MRSIIKQTLPFLLMIVGMSSCLDANDANIPNSSSSSFIELIYNEGDATTTINSGLNYFANAALLLSPDKEKDTITFIVSLQGASPLSRDLTVNAIIDDSKLNANIANDKINYLPLPDSLYDFINQTAVIKAGERHAIFQIAVYPSKIDFGQNYGLPITATNDGDVVTSSNYGHIYFHMIGNPIAGAYKHDFIRYSNPAGTGSPDGTSFYGEAAIFSPADPTTIHVPTGYYDGANYFITFTNNNGTLSNFKAVIDPASVSGAWATAGIVITSGPTITVNSDYTIFTCKYTTLTRNVTDIYYK